MWGTVWTQNGGAGSRTIRAIKTGQEIESGHYDVSWMLLGHGNTNGCHLLPYKDQGSVKLKTYFRMLLKSKPGFYSLFGSQILYLAPAKTRTFFMLR